MRVSVESAGIVFGFFVDTGRGKVAVGGAWSSRGVLALPAATDPACLYFADIAVHRRGTH